MFTALAVRGPISILPRPPPSGKYFHPKFLILQGGPGGEAAERA